MADYYPLISRAVSALDPNTTQRREAIYARAREALDRQLLSLDPPIPETDLRRERGALEATIRRVEAEHAPPLPPFRPVDSPPTSPREQHDPEPETAVEESRDRVTEPARPKVATGGHKGLLSGSGRKLAAAIGLPIVFLVAGLAYVLRDDPGRYLAQAPSAVTDTAAGNSARKSDSRLDGLPGAAPTSGARQRLPAQDSATLPVASRVLFFEESPTDPRGLQSDGMVVWRLESVATPGQPPDSVIRGTVTVPGAKMTGDIVIKRNRNAALPASHTIELIFRPEADREGIKEISPIEVRDQEANPGVTLQGAMVPVATNLFLIGLDRSEVGIARNLGALRDKRWFAFQFRFVSGKLGAFLVEKGQTGDRIFREALDSWQ